jgi:hypothetical protein
MARGQHTGIDPPFRSIADRIRPREIDFHTWDQPTKTPLGFYGKECSLETQIPLWKHDTPDGHHVHVGRRGGKHANILSCNACRLNAGKIRDRRQTLCQRRAASCGALCMACPRFMYPSRRYTAVSQPRIMASCWRKPCAWRRCQRRCRQGPSRLLHGESTV